MSTKMIAIELNPDTINHIMAVAAFVWSTRSHALIQRRI